MPSDETMKHSLIFDRNFNENSVDDVIKKFKDTVAFAKLDTSSSMSSEWVDLKQGHSDGGDIGMPPDFRLPPKNETGDFGNVPPKKPGMKQDVFTLDEGEVLLQWPAKLTPESYEDLNDWLQLILRKAKRSIADDSNDKSAEQ